MMVVVMPTRTVQLLCTQAELLTVLLNLHTESVESKATSHTAVAGVYTW